MLPSFYRSSLHTLAVIMTVVAGHCCGQAVAVGQENAGARSRQASIALAEKATALDAAIDRIRSLEGELKREKQQTAALSESLVAANAEGLQFSKDLQKLRLRVEALGPNLLEQESNKRLLAATSDLAIERQESNRLADQLLNVTEATMAFLSSDTEQQRTETLGHLEAQLRAADQIIGFRVDSSAAATKPLEASRIVSLKKDWGLLVIDSGSASGVKIGTPVEIVRSGRPVAAAVIVDVRGAISGAIVTSDEWDQDENAIRIGDSIRIAIAQNLQN